MDPNSFHEFKLVLLGASAAGKSSIVLRFCKGEFFENQEATIGAAFLTQSVPFDDYVVKLQIWDTAGQERYHSLAPMYYRGSAAAIVVFDVTDRNSFETSKKWVKELITEVSKDILVIVVGNKVDLEHKRSVQIEEAEEYTKEKGLIYIETSAKTGLGISELFKLIAKRLTEFTVGPVEKPSNNTIKITQQTKPPKRKRRC
ncbi:ras-related protein rab-5c [Anaeramoeba ignava]|uniref:Ras-related protein rab-5c n=1 Tax=Anaeramoeba ignava TaxID=1746090 RepID=A0A9Q0LRX4_ANAIG|nr:ras-related protein rab-5c [Anaeramoeba ignava]